MNMPLIPENGVNIFTPGNQNNAQVTVLLDDSYVVVWTSDDQDGDQEGIFGQHYSAQGQRIGAEFLINSTTREIQIDPSVAATEDGGFVVVWEARNQDQPGSFDFGVYGQRFGADAVAIGGEFQVNAVNTSATQFDAAVAGLPGGGFAVSYTDDLGDGSSDGIRVRVYDSAGVPAGDDFQVNSAISGNQGNSSITAIQADAGANNLAGVGFVVTWVGPGDGSGNGIYAQVYQPDGTAVGAEFQVNVSATSSQERPDVVGLAGGRFAIVWDENSGLDGSAYGVFARVFNGDGSAVGGQFQVNVETSSWQYQPSITATADGGFAVSWSSWTSGSAGDGSGYGVFARSFDADGVALTGEVQMNEQISGDQSLSDIAALNGGGFVGVWESQASGSAGDGSGQGIFHRLFGDLNTFVQPSAPPEVEAVSTVRVFDENTLNGAPQRIDADGAAAVSDMDSADFDGGRLIVSSLGQSVAEDEFPAQDADEQDQFGLDETGASPISISGVDVSVNGTIVGTISSDGADGADLVIDLNANANPAAVEVLIEHLTYQNTSDDPRPSTILSILLEDGDGSTSDPVTIQIQVNSEADIDGPVRDEVRVNTFEPSTQDSPDVTTLFDSGTGLANGYLATWRSINQDNTGDNDYGIFAQRYDVNGQAVGPEFQVNQTVAFTQFEPNAAGLLDGGFVIVWRDDLGDASGDGIRLTRYDAAGNPVAGQIEVGVNTEFSSTQFEPNVTALSDGGYQVSWTSVTSGSAGDGSGNGVFTQRYNAAGATVGGETQINEQTLGSQLGSQVAGMANGRFVAVWESATSAPAGDGSGQGVFARLFDSTGVAEGGEFQVNTFTASNQSDAQVAVLTNDEFVIVWRSEGEDTSSGGIYGQRYSSAGATIGDEFRINDSTVGDQTRPAITALDDGKFVVSWTDTSTPAPGSGADIFAQVFDADGTRLDSQVRINSEVLNTQDNAAMAFLPGGNYVVLWQSNAVDSNNIQQQIMGDPAEFVISDPPQLLGLASTIQVAENAANAGVQLFAGGVVTLTDSDSADFDGGSLVISRLVTTLDGDDYNAPDDNTQDSISVVDAGPVTVVGTDVRVNGVSIGTIISDGQGGAPLQVDFNANATVAAVEELLSVLEYANTSDNPQGSRSYSLALTDGDGSVQNPTSFTIDISQETDPGSASPVDGEQQVNSFTTGQQDVPHTDVLLDGGWVTVWQSADQDGSGAGLYGQRFNADGSHNGPEFKVNSTTFDDQRDAQVAGLTDGGWVVIWESDRQDNPGINDTGIIGQRYDASGAAIGGEFVVNTTIVNTQFDPAVAADPAGGFAVSWTTDTGDGNGDAVAYQRFDAAGAPVGAEIIVNEQIESNQGNSDLTYLSNGQILVTWVSPSSGAAGDGSGVGVFARILNQNGTFATGEFLVNQVTSSNQDVPTVAATATGFVIAWHDDSGQDNSGRGVQARFFDNTGAALGDEFTVNENRGSTQDFADVTVLTDGRVLIAWDSNQSPSGSGVDISGQLFTATGARIDGEFRINSEISSTQSLPDVTALPNGNFVVTWQSETSSTAGDGSNRGIFQQVYGDPLAFAFDTSDLIIGLPDQVTLVEADINAGLVRIDPDKTAAVPDLGTANFDTGQLSVAVVSVSSEVDQFSPPDNAEQHQLGFLTGDVGNGDVTASGAGVGSTISVDGVVVGTITADGVNGTPLTVTFNANATNESVEALLGNLGYSNTSNDPSGFRLSVDLSNGAGNSTLTEFIDLTLTGSDDLGLVGSDERIVNAHVEEIQQAPEIIELTGGGYVVVWQSRNQDQIANDFDFGVYAQVYGADNTPIGQEIEVNGTVVSTQADPAVAATDDGGFVVVWEARNQDNGADFDFGVIAQRYNADRTANGGEIVINTTIVSTQFDPSVAGLPGGGFVVAYTSDSGDGSIDSILSQRVDNTGTLLGEAVVNTTVASNQSQPDVAARVMGSNTTAIPGYVVVWTDPAEDGSSNSVRARMFDTSGAPLGADFQVNTTTVNSQSNASVAGNIGIDHAGFVVVWQDNSADLSSNGIFGQIYDASGAAVGGEFRVNDTTVSSQANPDVSALANGGFVVTWDGNGPGDSSGVFAQAFDPSGARVDTEMLVNQELSSSQYSSAVTGLAGGGFAVAFEATTSAGSGDGSSSGIILRTFEPSPAASNSPSLRDLDISVILGADDVTAGPVVLDNNVQFTDPDNANFDTGTLQVYYTRGPVATDQLSIATSGPITVVGSDVQFGGTSIGTIDATSDGANGAELLITFNANADALAVQSVVEHVAFASTDLAANIANTERGVGFVITDGNGGQTEPDAIFLDINSGSIAPTGLAIGNFALSENGSLQNFGPFSELALTQAPVVVDASIDFDDFAGTSFDTGIVRLQEASSAHAAQQLSVLDTGSGAGQIGFDGTNVSYEGTVIGVIDGTLDGANGADLQFNLNASATADGVEALMESFTFGLSGTTTDLHPDLSIFVQNQAGNQATSSQIALIITQDIVTVLPASSSEEQVNTFTTSNQESPRIADLTDGGYVVVWTSVFQDNPASGNRGIFGQRYNEFGQEIGVEFQVNDIAAGDQTQPRVTGLANGGFTVLWSDSSGLDGSGQGVFGHLYDANGNSVNAGFQVNEEFSSTQNSGQAVDLDSGRFMTIWTSQASGTAGDGSSTGIFGRVFDAAGVPEAGEFQINTTTFTTQQRPRAITLPDGDVMVVWEDYSGADGSGAGVFAQRIDSTGALVSFDGTVAGADEVQINTTTASTQNRPDVAALAPSATLPNGGFAMVWESVDSSGTGVFAQIYDINGVAQGSEFQVNLLESSNQRDPVIFGTQDGGFIVQWSDDSGIDGSSTGVVAQLVNADGTLNGQPFIVNEEFSSTQDQGEVTQLLNGTIVSVWRSFTSATAGDGSGYGVFQTLYNQPALPAGAMAPVLVGFEDTAVLDEADVNAGLQLIDPDGVISLTDMDSTDFDGGTLLVAPIIGSATVFEQQLGAPDNQTQDQVGILDGNGVTVAGVNVSVNAMLIGTIVQDGSNGSPLEIALNANATPEFVEQVLARLAYSNSSNDPGAVRQYAVQVSDGDGGSSGNNLLTINVMPEIDRAQVSVDADQQVNTFTAGNQDFSAVATLYDAGTGNPNGYVIVWQSQDQDRVQDGNSGVFGQIYDLDGNLIGGEFQVNDHSEWTQSQPSVTGLMGGGFVVGWQDNSAAHPAGLPLGETDTGVFGQVFAADGARVGSEFLINEQTSSTQDQIHLNYLADGGFVATWSAQNSAGSGDGSGQAVAARTFNADGTPRGGEFIVNQTTVNNQFDSEVVELSNGNLAFTWTADLQDNAPTYDYGVYARITDQTGANVVSEFLVNANVGGYQYDPSIAALAGGGFVLAWRDDSAIDGSGSAVYQQRYANDGTPVGGNVRVNDVTPNSQFEPSVIGLTNGGWVVTFSDNNNTDGSGTGVLAQVYAADGSRVDGNFVVNTEVSSTQHQPAVAALDNGNFVISFSAFTSGTSGDGSGYGVFQQLFAAPGTVGDSADPIVLGFPANVSFDEADLNAGPELLFGNLSIGDTDSADFDGGRMTLSVVQNDVVQPQFAAPDNGEQDQLSISPPAGSLISVVGVTDVQFNGTSIGTIVSDGADGADLSVTLNANASAAAVEALAESLAYANPSNDPETARLLALTLTDGDGGTFRQTVDVTIVPEADAVGPVDDEVQTNSFVTGEQIDPDVATLFDPGTGLPTGYVITWTSANQDATGDGQNGVFGQMYDISGAPVGGEFQVNTTTSGAQDSSTVTGLSTGGFAIAWRDAASGSETSLQVFDQNGVKVGTELTVNTGGFGQFNPALASFSNGDFVMVRQVQSDQSPFQNTIYGQRFDDAGGTVGLEFIIEDVSNNAFFDPAVAVLTDGKMIVVFSGTNLDNPGDFDHGVFGQLYAADGSVIGAPVQLNVRERFSQEAPSVAATDDGGFVVTYQSDFNDDYGYTPTLGVYVQKFDSNGNAVTGEILVNEIVDNSQFQPDVIGQPGGGFTVTFTDSNNTDGSANGVFAQTFDASGNRVDGRVLINQETLSSQDSPAIASLGGSNYAVAFRSDTNASAGDGSGSGIFHRIQGDPADFSVGGDPILDGINPVVNYVENTVNGIPQLIDANGAAAVSDPDSADFDGGSLLVSNVISSAPLINQINPPDDLTQDVLGLQQDARVTISGVDVSVDAVIVGQIIQDGAAGQPFEILLNANATPEVTEVLVEHLTYRNVSDDPLPTRQLRIQLTDGDGAASDPVLVQVNIAPTVDAAVPLGGENQANTFETGDQDTPAIGTLANGDFLIVWQSQGQDGSGEGVYAQRIDSLGNPVARDGTPLASGVKDEFLVNSTTTNNQSEAVVVGMPDGGFIVSWTDNVLDGSGLGVFAQRFDVNGAMVDPDGVTASVAGSGEFQVNSLTSSTQANSDIAVLEGTNAGLWVSIWHSSTSAGAGDGSGTGIIGQVFDTDGTLTGPSEFVINTETLSEQINPAVTALADGGFFVVWQSFSSGANADGSAYGIFGQRFDATFNPQGVEIQLNTTTLNNQTVPKIEALNNGNLIATWQDQSADGSSNGIYARIFAPDGTGVADEFRVNDQRINSQSTPDVTALDSGGFVITWDDNNGTDGSGVGVFGQQYDANGNRLDSQFQVNTEFSSSQFQPVVTELLGGGFAIAWTSVTSATAGDGSGNGIFYQIYANDSPAVNPVSAVGDEDTAIVLDEAVFEAGFVDPNGQTLQAIRIETLPTQGTLTVNGTPVFATQEVSIAQLINNELVYTGNQDFFGGDQFLWTGSDGISFAPGLVDANITVNPINDAPGLEAGANATVAEGQFFQRTLTLTDPDPDNRTISVDFDGDAVADQTFNSSSLTPVISHTFGAEGVFTVTVTVDDNAGQPNSVEVDTFTVTVDNAPPNAVNDFLPVSEDVADPPFDALFNDSDPGSDPFNLTLVNGAAFTVNVPILLLSGALVTVDGNGEFIYDPNGAFETLASNQFGNDSFTYTIEDDGGLTDVGTVSVQIDGQNDNPVAADDSLNANDDTPIVENVFADNGNGIDDDIDGDTFTVTEINGSAGDVGNQIVLPSGATVTLQSDGTLDYDPTTLTGSPASDSFTYQITDAFGGTDTATVTININASNSPPVAQDDAISTDEDTALLNADAFADNGNGIDDDGDGDTISVVSVEGSGANVGNQITLASGALLTMRGDGTFDYDPNGQFEATRVGATDSDSFTYVIGDGNGGTDPATVTVTINGVNDDPVAGNVFGNAVEDGAPVMGNLLVNSSDVDDLTILSITEVAGSALAVGVLQNRPSGATILIEANGDFTYDPAGGFQSLAENAQTTDFIGVTVADGDGGSDPAILSITVTGVNDAPTALDDDYSIGEDVDLNSSVFNDNGNGADFDIDTGGFFTLTEVNGVAADVGTQIALTSGALLTLNASGTFQYLQNGAFDSLSGGVSGNDSFTYTIEDNLGLTAMATVNLTIIGNADDPVANDDTLATDENTPVLGDLFADNGNGIDFDPDGDAITVSAVEGSGVNVGVATLLGSGATVTVLGDGSVTYDPGAAFDSLADGATDTDSFTYTISDGLGGVDTATVTINLTGVNDGPDARNDAFGIMEDDAVFSDSVFVNNGAGADSDPDAGDTFTVTEVNGAAGDVGNQISLASGALLTLNSDGSFDYDINDAFEFLSDGDPDSDTFTYTITDALGLMDTATATINITGENDDPVANDDSFSIVVSGNFSGNVLTGIGSAADSDIDQNDTLSVTDVDGNTGALGTNFALASGATVNMLSNGSFTYDSSGAGFTAPTTDSFTYGIADGNGGIDMATVNITVQPAGNTPPVAAAITDQFLEDELNRQTDLLDPNEVSDADLDDLDVANPVVTTEDLRVLSYTIDPETGLFSIDDGQFEDLADGQTFDITVDYDVTDGLASVANTATVTIVGENDAPVIDDPGSDVDGAVQEDDSSPTLTDTGDVLFSDVDLTDSHTTSVLFTGTDFAGGQLGSMTASISSQTSGTTGLGGIAAWSFSVSNAATQFLGSGQTVTETYDVSVDDSLASDTATVSVVITGINDGPVFDIPGSDSDAAVQEDDSSPNLSDAGSLLFSDVDLIDGHTASALFTGSDFAGGQLGGMTASVSTQTSAVDGQGGVVDWTFSIANADVQFLGSGQTVTETYDVSVDDGIASDTATVSVVITGVNDGPVIDVLGSDGDGVVQEDDSDPNLTDTGAILFSDVDLIDGHTVGASFTGTSHSGGQLGSLGAVVATQTSAVDGQGGVVDWTFTIANADVQFLGAGESITETYDVTVNDGIADDTFAVSVVINGVNDLPAFISDNDFTIDENQTFVDTVEAQDADANDVLSYSIDGAFGDGALFMIDAVSGDLSFTNAPDFETPLDGGGDNIYNVRVEVFDGTATETQDLMIEVLDVNDNALVVMGTPGFDQLTGTGGDETFQSLGGIIDFNIGGGGADTFSFGAETSNGVKEFDYILDFGADDFLDLGGASIVQEFNAPSQTTLILDGDGDVIVLSGVANFDEANQLV